MLNFIYLKKVKILNYVSLKNKLDFQSTMPIPKDGLPSIIHLFELNVIGNVLFRYASVIPFVLRVFHAHSLRYQTSI